MILLFPFLIYSLLYRPTVFCMLKQVDSLILKIFSKCAFIKTFFIFDIMFLIFMCVVCVCGGGGYSNCSFYTAFCSSFVDVLSFLISANEWWWLMICLLFSSPCIIYLFWFALFCLFALASVFCVRGCLHMLLCVSHVIRLSSLSYFFAVMGNKVVD